jgi:hypothetical protein
MLNAFHIAFAYLVSVFIITLLTHKYIRDWIFCILPDHLK